MAHLQAIKSLEESNLNLGVLSKVFSFPSYDTDDYDLPEDIDWMSQFIPGQLPDWILDIEDQNERDEMMEMMGIGVILI